MNTTPEYDRTERWIANVKNGETKDFEYIIRMYQQRIFAYVYSLLRQRQEAEDLTQDVFLQAFSKLHTYESNVSFSAWLYKIAYRLFLNRRRKHNGWLKILHLFQPAGDVTAETGLDSFELSDCLHGLSDLDKQIVLLRAIEEKSFEELSQIFDINAAAIRKKYERAKKKIKTQWTEELEWSTNNR